MSQMQTEQLTDRRSFTAPPSLLFRAWTDPALIARWWGPTGTATLDADLRVGGAYRLAMLLPNGETLATVGTYTAVTESQRLAFTFAWEGGEEPETQVTIELRDLGGTTELVLSHTGFPTAAERDNHSLGWRDNLDRYSELIRELARPVYAEVTVAAAPELVWWAWTITERVTAFFAPDANIVARVGGAYEVFFDPANQDHMSTKGCVVTVLEPQERLGFTWKGPDQFAPLMNGEGALTSVLVTIRPGPGGTVVSVEHGGWGEGDDWAQAREWHVMAWEQVLTSLKSALESGQGSLCCSPV